MAYVISKMDNQLVDAIATPASWTRRDPIYSTMFDQIAQVRGGHTEKGTSIKTPDWSLVAQLPSTLLDVLKTMSPDGVHLDKKQFYAFLKRNPQYLARDERFGKWGQ